MILTNKPGADACTGGKPPQPHKMGANTGGSRQSGPRAQGVGSRKLWFLGALPRTTTTTATPPRWAQGPPGKQESYENVFDACIIWPRGVTVSTLDPESSDRGSNPREAFVAYPR